MYYQVSYTDSRDGKRRRSSMIHKNQKDAQKEMLSKTKIGHRNVVIILGRKLSK